MDNQIVQGYEYWATRPKEDPKRDWKETTDNWVKDYVLSKNHSHRELILEGIKSVLPTEKGSVLELGCNAGPNLLRIHERFPLLKLAGIDANEEAVKEARNALPKYEIYTSDFTQRLPFADKSFSIVLADAALMYVSPNDIIQTMAEIKRVANKAILLVEWFDESELGVLKDYHWARNYGLILAKMGCAVTYRQLTSEEWNTPKWHTNGQFILGLLPQ